MVRRMTIAEIVDEVFGGTARMAELFEVTMPAVSNWKAAGRFPARLHYRIAKEAGVRGVKLPNSVFEDDTHIGAAE